MMSRKIGVKTILCNVNDSFKGAFFRRNIFNFRWKDYLNPFMLFYINFFKGFKNTVFIYCLYNFWHVYHPLDFKDNKMLVLSQGVYLSKNEQILSL